MAVAVTVTVMRQGEVCQAVIRGTSIIVPAVPVAVVTVAVDVDGVLSVELWLVMLILEMEAG